MEINTANLQALFTGFSTAFRGGLTTAQPMWPRVATQVPSSTEMNLYSWLGAWPKMREWIGDRQIRNIKDYGYSIGNKPFESTIGILRDKIEDDQYGIFSTLFQEMGYAAAVFPDENTWPLLSGGNTAKCYDGQNFFDASHPVGGGTVSNIDTGGAGQAWFLLCTNRPLKPFIYQTRRPFDFVGMQDPTDERVFNSREFRYGVDTRCNFGYGLWQMAYRSNQALNSDNYYAARQAMDGFKTDQGQLLAMPPDLCVVGISNRKAAEATFLTQRLANGGDNPVYKAVDILVCPYLP